MAASKKSDEYSELSEGNYVPAIYDLLLKKGLRTKVAIYFGYLIWNKEYWDKKGKLTKFKGKNRYHLSYEHFKKDFFLGASTQYRFNQKLKEFGLIDIADKKGIYDGRPKTFHQYWVNYSKSLRHSKYLMVNFNLAFHLGNNFGMALYLVRLIKKRDELINKGAIHVGNAWFYDEYGKCTEQIGIPRGTQEDYDKKLETLDLISVDQKTNLHKGKLRYFLLNMHNIMELVRFSRPGFELKKDTKGHRTLLPLGTNELGVLVNEVLAELKAQTIPAGRFKEFCGGITRVQNERGHALTKKEIIKAAVEVFGEFLTQRKPLKKQSQPEPVKKFYNDEVVPQSEFPSFIDSVETFSGYKPPAVKGRVQERAQLSPHERQLEELKKSVEEYVSQSDTGHKGCFGTSHFSEDDYCNRCIEYKECSVKSESIQT